MAFYELTKTTFSSYDNKRHVYYRSAHLDKVIAFKERQKYSNPDGRYGLKIVKVEYIENDDASISRYEFVIFGDRDLGPLFSNLPDVGFFDFRNEVLTDDQKTILGIYLKGSKSKIVDTLDVNRIDW
jgi:hypothetical protein